MLLDLAAHVRGAMPAGGSFRLESGLLELDAEQAMGMAAQPGRYARLTARDSGPGLATLHALVSQYGGCVTVTSEPGDTASEILLPSPR